MIVHSLFALALLLASFAPLSGCGAGSRSPYLNRSEPPRNPLRAQELHEQATRLAEREPENHEQIEKLLREALAADLYHGPSHNNLGILYLDAGRLYEAASEFEWARKLMPGHPAPRVNLAMTLERAGKADEAIAAYDAALAVYQGYLPAVQGKARLLARAIEPDDEALRPLLEEIALRGDERWREWAMREVTRLARTKSTRY